MENLELREALQRYVRSDEPPFPFTAGALIAQGRGRQRRRIALGLAGGGAMTTLAVLSGMVLVPGMSGGDDLFADQQCRWTLPTGTYSWPTPQPTSSPQMQQTPPPFGESPSPQGSPPPVSPPPVTPDPTPDVTPDATPDVTPGGTITASRMATSEAQTPAMATPPPTVMPGQVDPERLRTMSCFLKKELLELLPDRNHVPPSESPLEPMENPIPEPGNGWRMEYYARTSVIERGLLCHFDVRVQPLAHAVQLEHGVATTTPGGKRAYVIRDMGMPFGSPSIGVFVRTADSHISIFSEGTMLTVEQLLVLGDAPELDLYR